jgi:acyl-homoserine lactone acylase PvdQ
VNAAGYGTITLTPGATQDISVLGLYLVDPTINFGAGADSFVAAVEFGKPVRAKAIMSGGESGHPASAHFTDQAEMYSKGRFRDVLFLPEDVAAHAERTYRPGDPAL